MTTNTNTNTKGPYGHGYLTSYGVQIPIVFPGGTLAKCEAYLNVMDIRGRCVDGWHIEEQPPFSRKYVVADYSGDTDNA